MYNRDHYDSLVVAIHRLIETDEILGEVSWLIDELYDLKDIKGAKNLIDNVMIGLHNQIEKLVIDENIDFGDGNMTGTQEFIDMMEKKKRN